jgi:hypothetical protein
MKWIILNQIPHLQHYIYHYLKQPENYKHLNYRVSDDFEFFEPDRAILITNKYNNQTKRFIEDAKEHNVFISLITENTTLINNTFQNSFLVREKENYINQNFKVENLQYNISSMHFCMPKILNWIKRKKKGQFNFFNKELRKTEDNFDAKIVSNYILPSEGVEIEDKIFNVNEVKKVNIYMPTYYRFHKTKTSIEDILSLAKESKHDVKIYIGDNNTQIPEMHDWLKELSEKEEIIEVYFNKENQGKAMVVNYLEKNVARKDYDYVFSIDSDMRKESELNKLNNNVLDKMIEILETCTNVGLVAANQSELSQHWYGRTVSVKEDRGFKIGVTNNGIGVAGGALCIRKDDWYKIGGYKENHDVYTGDDSILTYNVFRKLGKEAVIAHDYYLRHPKGDEDEKEYTEWKMKSWQRDNVNFIKDNYTGSNTKGFFDK